MTEMQLKNSLKKQSGTFGYNDFLFEIFHKNNKKSFFLKINLIKNLFCL